LSSIKDLKSAEDLREVLRNVAEEFLREIYVCALAAENERRLELFKKGFELAKRVEDLSNQSLFGAWLAWDNIGMGNIDKALILAEKSVALDRKTSNMAHLPQSLVVLGCIHLILGNWDKSERYFKEAFDISQEQNDFEQITNIQWSLGWFHFDKGEYIKAKEHFEICCEVHEKAGDIEGQMDSYQWVIWTYLELREIKKAKNFIDNLRKLAVETEHKEYIAASDALRGMLFRAQKKWKESIEHFEKSLQHNEALKARQWNVYWFAKMVLCEYARVYLERNQEGDREKAHNLLNQALEIFQKLGAKKDIEKTVAKKKLLTA